MIMVKKQPQTKTSKQTLVWHYIKSKKDLPEIGNRVLLKIKYSFGNQEDTYSYGYLAGIGITKAGRARMKMCERKYTIKKEDQHGNNLVPWYWFGNYTYYWGQDVVAWTEI